MIPDLEIPLLRTFVAVNDTGSITLAGRQVGRTQPAVTHQMHRLEKALGKPLFAGDRRHLTLTREGEMLLGYARTLLGLNDEIRDRFQAPDISGHVRLGVPDLYAAFLLPAVLGGFARAYPQIEIELRCSRSVHLHAALEREEIDIALMTRQPEFEGGTTVREEPLIWVAARDYPVGASGPLPLALLPAGSLYRQRALDALGHVGRSWTVTAVSDSIAGLQAAVYAGLAISIFPLCALSHHVRRLGPADGLPVLPALEIVLQRKPSEISAAAEHLAQYIVSELGNASR
ncbi:LysR substrate-binding domain-containing protein [Methylobacterium oxalidis]|uniref:LysR family transcriptional regulator n=1 Tax=Methylobacterium oxalidis TaxID=944322 RepID=A0A512J1U3_9HYPH|nr:LysR substrate-binding domain-containing protein [Methylobacterium oxalidis]GEP03897.1 LysR family transcriptional regulator [Methylobacterium oxalidis]GJE31227.1 HTH-type transcriptional activator CmpR [Methylobacterium oxalidis]GLS65244.1 LysR family transcriptional regulator [Methylobacterium oxalidis]